MSDIGFEDEPEDSLLVEHVPGLGNALLALSASVEVQPGSKAHECHVLEKHVNARINRGHGSGRTGVT